MFGECIGEGLRYVVANILGICTRLHQRGRSIPTVNKAGRRGAIIRRNSGITFILYSDLELLLKIIKKI